MGDSTHSSLVILPQRRSHIRQPTTVYPSFSLVLSRQSHKPHKKRRGAPITQSVAGWGMVGIVLLLIRASNRPIHQTTIDYRPEPTPDSHPNTEPKEIHEETTVINLTLGPRPDNSSEINRPALGDPVVGNTKSAFFQKLKSILANSSMLLSLGKNA
ncbi:hypothetical protein BD410DRAFT_5226 [Rickenella mellea]|uniref:Uncharacterized protein n=1 Tax=Rickenella mellea TaxID=50990 RepID=A0A4R5XDK1_9AGAM|nr:hypothetical protein BD410DRAFT_5226 [Rickenella mellea]